jgi:hypothetical protein
MVAIEKDELSIDESNSKEDNLEIKSISSISYEELSYSVYFKNT